MQLTSNKPYLLRATYEWLVDNNVTPHIVIFADNPKVDVPRQYVDDGKIVLNISPSAAQDLLIDNDGVSFSARFAGKPHHIYTPIGAVLALYANENGEGMMFEADDSDDTPPEHTPPDGSSPDRSVNSEKPSKRPALKIVK